MDPKKPTSRIVIVMRGGRLVMALVRSPEPEAPPPAPSVLEKS